MHGHHDDNSGRDKKSKSGMDRELKPRHSSDSVMGVSEDSANGPRLSPIYFPDPASHRSAHICDDTT